MVYAIIVNRPVDKPVLWLDGPAVFLNFSLAAARLSDVTRAVDIVCHYRS